MKRGFVLVSVFIASLLLLPLTSLAYLELDAVQNSKSAYLMEDVAFDFILKNRRYLDDPVAITIKGEHREWLQSTYTLINMEGNSQEEFSINYYPTGDVSGIFRYTIKAESLISKLSVTEDFYLDVKRPAEITGFEVTKDGTLINMEVTMESNAERTVTLNFELIGRDSQVIDSFSREAVLEEGENALEYTIEVSESMPACDYMIRATLEGTSNSRTSSFTVMPVHDVVESVTKKSSPLYEEFEITVYNNGNVPEPLYVVQTTVPNNDLITGFVTSPSSCSGDGDNQDCNYVIKDLEPGATALVTYRLDFWSIYAQYSLIIIAILGVAAFGFFRAASPTIRKKASKRGMDKHHIVLEIKNPFYHSLSNVIVRDWVSPLASVLHDEIEMFKPLVRRSDAGTELIWRLGDMRPRETRIITYPIKTLVQGSLKMPRAYIRFNKPNGKFSRIFSGQLIVE